MSINYTAPIEIRDGRNGNWFWVDKEIWSDERLTSSDKVVYGTLAYFSNQNSQSSFPSIEKLKSFSSLSGRQVYSSIKKLESLQHVVIKRRHGKANIYILLDNGINHLKEGGAKFAGVQDKPTTLADFAVEGVQDKPTNNIYINNTLNTKVLRDGVTPKRGLPCPLNSLNNPLKTKYPKGHIECGEYIASFSSFVNKGKQFKCLHAMLRAGLDFPDIDKIIARMEKKPFYKDNGWDLASVASEADRRINASS